MCYYYISVSFYIYIFSQVYVSHHCACYQSTLLPFLLCLSTNYEAQWHHEQVFHANLEIIIHNLKKKCTTIQHRITSIKSQFMDMEARGNDSLASRSQPRFLGPRLLYNSQQSTFFSRFVVFQFEQFHRLYFEWAHALSEENPVLLRTFPTSSITPYTAPDPTLPPSTPLLLQTRLLYSP